MCVAVPSAQTADFTVKRVIDITANATVIVALETDTGTVPVPVRFKGIVYPEGAQALVDLAGALRESLKEADGKQFRIISIGDTFDQTDTGILLGVIEIKTSSKTKDGARIGGTQELIASLLNFGACAYDGSFVETDPKRHKMFSTTQDHAKGNKFGVWSEK
jgi:hypothetical protein